MTALMDLEEQAFEHEEVCEAINDMRHVAAEYPTRRRNCICCRRRAVRGEILCTTCEPTYGATINAE